jgi:hypothetical protein
MPKFKTGSAISSAIGLFNCARIAFEVCNTLTLDVVATPMKDLLISITSGILRLTLLGYRSRYSLLSGSLKGIFSEHCLEHFSLRTGFEVLSECRRLLRLGGSLRIVVPDAERYLDLYHRQNTGDTTALFPFQNSEAFDGIYFLCLA